jgi:methylmalonyl-CoA/ethylmalonyl-CoA epimerase
MPQVFQVAQRAVDLDRAGKFYARLLQAEPTGVFDPPGLVFFQVGAVRLLLDRVAPSALIYLRVADVAEEIERCRADGVEIVAEPHVIFEHQDDSLGPAGTREWMAFLTDSEGNTVGLVSHEPKGADAGPSETS